MAGACAVHPATAAASLAGRSRRDYDGTLKYLADARHGRARLHRTRAQDHPRRHRRLGAGDRPGGPRPGHLQRQALLRRLDRLRRRAQQQRQPRRRGDAGHAAGHQRVLRRAGGPHRPRAEGAGSTSSRASTGRTTSIRTCRRATRSASSTTPSSARARCWSTWAPASPAASASSASTSSRTPASRSTTSTPTSPSSTSTAPASR